MTTDSEVFKLLGELGAIDDEANCRAVREALNAARAAGFVAGRRNEREACARECDAMAHGSITAMARDNCADMAAIIRARTDR